MPRSIFTLGLAAVTAACAAAPMNSGPLIDRFSRAACVPAGRVKNVYPAGWLAWDYVVETRCHARIVGAQGSTGSIGVEYPPDPARHVVADFGEKSNPVEVRLDPDACRLYVKANGSPVFTNRPPMWLLEYDLLRREEVQSAKVEPGAVSTTCPRTLDAR
jgi:hypothetical protein